MCILGLLELIKCRRMNKSDRESKREAPNKNLRRGEEMKRRGAERRGKARRGGEGRGGEEER